MSLRANGKAYHTHNVIISIVNKERGSKFRLYQKSAGWNCFLLRKCLGVYVYLKYDMARKCKCLKWHSPGCFSQETEILWGQ